MSDLSSKSSEWLRQSLKTKLVRKDHTIRVTDGTRIFRVVDVARLSVEFINGETVAFGSETLIVVESTEDSVITFKHDTQQASGKFTNR